MAEWSAMHDRQPLVHIWQAKSLTTQGLFPSQLDMNGLTYDSEVDLEVPGGWVLKVHTTAVRALVFQLHRLECEVRGVRHRHEIRAFTKRVCVRPGERFLEWTPSHVKPGTQLLKHFSDRVNLLHYFWIINFIYNRTNNVNKSTDFNNQFS